MILRILDWVFSTPTTPPAWPKWLCRRMTDHDVAVRIPSGHTRCRCALFHGPRDQTKSGPDNEIETYWADYHH